MDPIMAAAIAGGLIEGGIGMVGGSAANRANIRQARESMAFQERMSSTAYQRSVSDMRSAGLNPLYWLKGSGATTPGGAMATSKDVTEGFRGTTAKALEQRVANATVLKLMGEAKNQSLQGDLYAAQTRAANNASAVSILRQKQMLDELVSIKNEAEFRSSRVGKFLQKLGIGFSDVGELIGAINPFKGGGKHPKGAQLWRTDKETGEIVPY